MRLPFVQRVSRTGPVEIGTGRNREGHKTWICACTSERCGWGSDFPSYTAAVMAARGHRCRVN